jgi:hypothetical protein
VKARFVICTLEEEEVIMLHKFEDAPSISVEAIPEVVCMVNSHNYPKMYYGDF